MTDARGTATAAALLESVDPLSFTERMRHVSDVARELAGTAELDSLLRELGGGGTFERRLGLTMAAIAGQSAFVEERLGDPDITLRIQALAFCVRRPDHDDAVIAALEDAPAAWRVAVVRAVRKARRTTLADRLIGAGLLPEAEAARLLPACSPAVVAELLPEYSHAPVRWAGLGAEHPGAVLDHVEERLAELPDRLRDMWWARCADGVAAAIDHEPGRVFELVERYQLQRSLLSSPPLRKRLGDLVRADAGRTIRLLTAGDQALHLPVLSRSIRQRLLRGATAGAVAWGRQMRERPRDFALLLKALPPSQRTAYFDAVSSDQDLRHALVDVAVLDVLPHQRRYAEARRMLKLRNVLALPMMRLPIVARLPWSEARAELLDLTRVADADHRAFAYPLLISCAAAGRDAAVFGRFLAEDLTRLRNEQDPVRRAAITALAAVSADLFDGSAVEPLTRIATDAVEARDLSYATGTALRTLALRILAEQAVSGDEDLISWALLVAEQGISANDRLALPRLDTMLRRGQERVLVDTMTPWVRRGMERGDHRLAIALATSLRRRAHAMPDVQGWLEDAIRRGTSATARLGISLWLADPAHRDERVGRLIAWDASTAVLHDVAGVIARRRTDLLDPYLTGDVIGGRFVASDHRWYPEFGNATTGWLPRQLQQYARLLAHTAADSGAKVSARADAISKAAALGEPGTPVVERYLGSTDIVLLEAALSALAWAPDPAAAIPTLLGHADGDRARVAIYAVTRAARYAKPSQVEAMLREVLRSRTAKVTSRKECLRIAAAVGVPDLAGLLIETWNADGQHRHVQAAAVTRIVQCLDDERSWAALRSAADGDPDIAVELLRVEPLDLPRRHRAGFGRLVAQTCRISDLSVRSQAYRVAPTWYAWTPEIADAVVGGILDLRDPSPAPAFAVYMMLGAGWPLEEYVRLLTRLADLEAAGKDAFAEHDRPARRRLEGIAAEVVRNASFYLKDWRPMLRAASATLADRPGWLRQAAELAAAAVDLLDDLRELVALADLTAGRPLTARAAADVVAARIASGAPVQPDVLLAAAKRLASDPRPSAGIVAAGLSRVWGPSSGWDKSWRDVVRTLRSHQDSDVAELALALDTSTLFRLSATS